MLWRGLQEAGDVASAGEVLAFGAQHDHPHIVVGIKRLEGDAKLLALRHGNDVEGRAAQHDVGALAGLVDLDAVAIEGGAQGERGVLQVVELHGVSVQWG